MRDRLKEWQAPSGCRSERRKAQIEGADRRGRPPLDAAQPRAGADKCSRSAHSFRRRFHRRKTTRARDVHATEARGSCRAPRRGAAGTLDEEKHPGGSSPLRQRGESEGGHGAELGAARSMCGTRASFRSGYQAYGRVVRQHAAPIWEHAADSGRAWGEKITITITRLDVLQASRLFACQITEIFHESSV